MGRSGLKHPTVVRYIKDSRVKVSWRSGIGHHRTPAYIKGKTGRVTALCGLFHNPESRAYGGSGLPKQPLYKVEFNQTEVWVNYRGSSMDKIHVDIYEHWLEPA